MDDLKEQQERAHKVIDDWPDYKKQSIVRNGHIEPWTCSKELHNQTLIDQPKGVSEVVFDRLRETC